MELTVLPDQENLFETTAGTGSFWRIFMYL
jgi:hypothetical protein